MMPPISRRRPRSLRRRRLIIWYGSSSFIVFRLKVSDQFRQLGVHLRLAELSSRHLSWRRTDVDRTCIERLGEYRAHAQTDGIDRVRIARGRTSEKVNREPRRMSGNGRHISIIGEKWPIHASLHRTVHFGLAERCGRQTNSHRTAHQRGCRFEARAVAGHQAANATSEHFSPYYRFLFRPATAEMMFSALGLAVASMINGMRPTVA